MNTAFKHPSFKSPTIAEALCELHFLMPEGRPWNQQWFGDLFKSAGNDYPRMEPTEVVEIGAGFLPDGVIQQVRRIGVRTLYHHATRPHLLQLSETTFTVNEVAPYPGWDVFIDDIKHGWELLAAIVQPAGLSRIGLRFINRIPRGGPTEPVSKWLAPTDYVPTRILEATDRFHSRLQVPLGSDMRLVVSVADLEEDDRSRWVLLDIDTILNTRVAPEWAAIRAQADRLHDAIWDVFSRCMTEDLRAVLEGDRHAKTR